MKNIESIYPITSLQEGILFHSLSAPESEIYFGQLSCVLNGPLDKQAFRQAWRQVIDRHEVLRTAFTWQHLDEPLQVMYAQIDVPWTYHDWRDLSTAGQQERLHSLHQSDRKQGFRLDRPPLTRLSICRLDENKHQLLWSFHHLLLDRWSVALVLEEILSIHEALSSNRAQHLPDPLPFRSYLAWLKRQDHVQAESFWRRTLTGFSSPTPLPAGRDNSADRAIPADSETYQIQHVRFPASLTASLNAAARRYEVTLNTLFQGAWALLLSRYSGQQDVVFGTTVSIRPAELTHVEKMVGLLINTLPVRVHVNADETVISWLRRLMSEQVELRKYAYSPLVEIQGWSEVRREQPLFESLLVFENIPLTERPRDTERSVKIGEVHGFQRTNYPLVLTVSPGHELTARLTFKSDRFDGFAIQRLLGHFRTLLEGMISSQARKLSDLSLLTDEERQKVLVDWNQTEKEFQPVQALHKLFEQQAQCTPDRIALVFEEEHLTYRALDTRANQLAHCLQSLGVGPETLVGLFLDRSVEMMVALLAVLKAGGAYVPMSPAFPYDRLGFMLADADAPVLLTTRSLSASLSQHRAEVIYLEEWSGVDWPCSPVTGLVQPEDAAYVIYTSGSTGRPKGVVVEHRQIYNYVMAICETYGLREAANFAMVQPLAVDSVHTVIFPPLITGAVLHVISESLSLDAEKLAVYFERHNIDILKIAPSHLRALQASIDDSGRLLPRQKLIIGGEASNREWAEEIEKESPCSVFNHYGPTETTVGVLTYQVGQQIENSAPSTLPLGRPFSNITAYILDQDQRPVPIGVPGELCIGGLGVTRGYLNQPDQTSEKFRPDPFIKKPGARIYRTGDVARYLPDGNIEFLGRKDHQVKIRGFRIELEEIECVLDEHEQVRQSVVIAKEEASGDKRLEAYVVLQQGQALTVSALRQFLQSRLPDVMVPQTLALMEILPLTSHGKVDRKALRTPELSGTERDNAFVAPRSKLETILAGIWVEVLDLEFVGIHDNFFDLGGHSLHGMRVFNRVHAALPVELPLSAMFEAPTIAKLAEKIEAAR